MIDSEEIDDLMTHFNSLYYSIDEFNEMENTGLMVLHQNIRSFNANFDCLSVFLNSISRDVDIVVLTETWFSDIFCSDISGYNDYHVFRSEKIGGGVSIYVRESLQSRFRNDISVSTDVVEACIVEIVPEKSKPKQFITVVGTYRPPSSCRNSFIERVGTIIGTHNFKHSLLVGDFNIDLLDDSDGGEFADIMYQNNYFPLINIPTRVTDTSSKCIDNIWCNCFNVVSSGVFVTGITDHYTIFAVLGFSPNKIPIIKTIRDHSDCCLEALAEGMSAVVDEFNFVYRSTDVNTKTTWFNDTMLSLYNRHCPVRTKFLSTKKMLKPWVSNDIVREINKKHRLFKLHKQGIIPFHVYNQHKNRLSKLLLAAKHEFYSIKFKKNRSDIKKNWKVINSILNKNKKSIPASVLVDGDRELTCGQEISDHFSNFFSTIAGNLDQTIPASATDPLNYMSASPSRSFFASPSTVDEVVDIIMALPTKSSPLDCVPIFIYKKMVSFVAPILCDIFNSSISRGVFPDVLKVARVVPIHKAGNRNIVSNFRPISILPLISKVIEKVMKVRVLEYFEKYKIIYDKQFGFRSGYSTSDAVVEFVDRCASSLDNKKFTVAVFLDLSKAFDTVNKDIMVRKLERVGFRGAVRDWFHDYLSNRGMFVDCNGFKSSTKTLNIGLPQGSVSSPYLFSLYVNDMHRASDRLSFINFADDTTIYMSGNNLESLYQDVNCEMGRVVAWLNANRLSLNVSKTKYMLFTHSPSEFDHNLVVNGINVERVFDIKFLGITIDNRLNFNSHVKVLSRKLSCIIGVMSRMLSFVPPNIIKLLYFSMLYPHIIYGICVWGGCGVTNTNKIKRLQNRAISMFVNKVTCRFPPLLFTDIYRLRCLCLFHRLVYGDHNVYFKNKIVDLVPVHQHSTRFREGDNLLIPRLSKTVSQRQYLYNTVVNWNSLPLSMKQIADYKYFVAQLKTFLCSHVL